MPQRKLTKSYIHQPCDTPLEGNTVADYLDLAAELFPDRDALVFIKDGTRKTFAQLHRDVNDLAAGLLQFGLHCGDNVGIWAEENYQWLVTDFAVSTAGCTSVRFPVNSTPERLRHLLKKVNCKVLVIGSIHTNPVHILSEIIPSFEFYSEKVINCEGIPNLKHIISMSPTNHPSIIQLCDVINLGKNDKKEEILKEAKHATDSDSSYAIVFTSGSTGDRKAVALRHRRLQYAALQMEYQFGYTGEKRDSERIITNHVNDFTSGMHTMAESLMLTLGATVVFPHPNTTEGILDAVQREKCNLLNAFPMNLSEISNAIDISKYDVSSIVNVICTGGTVPLTILNKVAREMQCNIELIYSSLECAAIALNKSSIPLEDKISTYGSPAPYYEIKVTDLTTGRITPVGVPGQICVRSPFLLKEYVGDKELTTSAKSGEGWFRTGDSGKLDERGVLKVMGRTDDVIIKGGINIYPAEVEQIVCQNPKIKLHQVVGVPDEQFVNELCLCVVLHDSTTSTESELKDYFTGKLDDFRLPKYILFLKEFPMTETNKIKRNDLAKLAAKMLHLEK
ncbi:medium-chain acyl-CoA ligase ACSF2, mitochondrial-like [Ptychodera flava]|uniref:medium-chain acyl-CoA ligase ACSF2, mitochondrial-like n=1 Tax=Ptychodera flava TaxID=63121 RepID=UPI003969CB19